MVVVVVVVVVVERIKSQTFDNAKGLWGFGGLSFYY